jgi:pimeloyl-ACP methyl ester carboxylesterase
VPRGAPERFEIRVAEADLVDLRERLARTRLPLAPRDNADWSHGPDAAYLQPLLAYWRDRFDWRAQEAKLNALAHYRVELHGADGAAHRVHFVHLRSAARRPLPLILTHGWPSTFREFVDVAPRLAHPEKFGGNAGDGCDVVIPSLIGYGFSSRPGRAIGPIEMSELWHELMTRVLGYARFVAHAGDWGSLVSSQLALRHPESLLGLHLTMLPMRAALAHPSQPPLTPEEKEWLAQMRAWWEPQLGYRAIQSTRPQALAYGLADSPAGLAAWLVDKYFALGDVARDDPNAALERRFPHDLLLTQLSIYWFTRTIETANALYKAARPEDSQLPPGRRIDVPTGYADHPIPGMPRTPRSWAERSYAIRRFTLQPRGGHFAAMEEPELFASELQAFVRDLR